jgi:hypothetical protein
VNVVEELRAELEETCGHPDSTVPISVRTLAALLEAVEALKVAEERMRGDTRTQQARDDYDIVCAAMEKLK